MGLGGKREGAGRKPGKVSQAKRELAEMAKDIAEDALAVLAEIMRDVMAPHSARVSAANAILDRGYGKPPQAITGPGPNGEHTIKTEDAGAAKLAAFLDGIAERSREAG